METVLEQEIIEALLPGDVVYISGPMTGLPDFNYPAFNAMAKALKKTGCRVLNPARHGHGKTWEEYMRLALIDIAKATVFVVLPGFGSSRGAGVELELAQRLDIPRFYHQPQMALGEAV